MPDVVINYADIIKSIGEQIQSVWKTLKDNENFAKEISNIEKIEVSDEQSFNKKRGESKIEKGAVYIVVRFGAGSINYGSTVAPISLYVIGTANKVKPTQLLLGVFASAWTTKNLSQGLDGEISHALQVWNTPEIITNFNEVDIDFKNLFRLTGNIVIGASAIRMGTLTYIFEVYNEEQEGFVTLSETVNIMSFQDGYRAVLDPQPFGNTKGFAKSEVDFSTYTFSISTYLLNTSYLAAAALSVRGFRNRTTSGIGAIFNDVSGQLVQNNTHFVVHKNSYLKLKIEFTNGFTNFPVEGKETANEYDDILGDDFFTEFKILDSQIGQELAGLPTLTITFTR